MENALLQNGFLHLALGILVGMPYMRLIARKDKEKQEAWRIAHLSGLITGALMIGLSLTIDKIKVSENVIGIFVYLFISSNWIFILGLFISGFTGERGLTRKPKKKIGLVIFSLYCLASMLSLVSALMLVCFSFYVL